MLESLKRIASNVVVSRLRCAADLKKQYSLDGSGIGTLYFSNTYSLPSPMSIGDLNSVADDLSESATNILKTVKTGAKPYNIVVGVTKVNSYDVEATLQQYGGGVFKAPVRFLYNYDQNTPNLPSLEDYLKSLGFEKSQGQIQ